MASTAARAGSRIVVGSKGPAITRKVKPIQSTTPDEARWRVKAIYKKWQRAVPRLLHEYKWDTKTVFETKLCVKRVFAENKSVTDPRAVDILAHKAEIEFTNTDLNYNQSCHIFSYLYRDHLEEQPKDFLTKFFAGKD